MTLTTAHPPKPTAAELDLLRVMWQLGPASVKEVLAARLPELPDLNYATVLRLMQIMHAKGLLTRDESQHSHVYAPAQPQQALQSNLLLEMINKVFGGSGKKLVLAALDSHISKSEREEIKRFLKENPDA